MQYHVIIVLEISLYVEISVSHTHRSYILNLQYEPTISAIHEDSKLARVNLKFRDLATMHYTTRCRGLTAL